MGSHEVKAYCELDGATRDLLKHAMSEYKLSGRAIADLHGAEKVGIDHESEAIKYRSLDRQL